MTKDDIEARLLNFAEDDDDWKKVVDAYNLGLKIAGDNVRLKDELKRFTNPGYSTYKKVLKIDKKSITKWKITI